jgi:hypothetical protein
METIGVLAATAHERLDSIYAPASAAAEVYPSLRREIDERRHVALFQGSANT